MRKCIVFSGQMERKCVLLQMQRRAMLLWWNNGISE
jgi:hypothetical protein